MNGRQLYRALSALDDDLIQDAADLQNMRRRTIYRMISVAACFCVALTGLLMWWLWNPGRRASQSEGVLRAATAEEIQARFGYEIGVPDAASAVSYAASGERGAALVQAEFTLNNLDYTYRVQETAEATDISGLSVDWEQVSEQQMGDIAVTLKSGAEGSLASWYDGETHLQRSLYTALGSAETVASTAADILQTLGYHMDTAPEGAEHVEYGITDMGKDYCHDMAETAFEQEGIHYVFRTLSTDHVENIAGVERDWTSESKAEIGWCSAEMHYDEGGEGYILWYDAAPGLLYSLYMDSGASADALTAMAEELYIPMQGDVG